MDTIGYENLVAIGLSDPKLAHMMRRTFGLSKNQLKRLIQKEKQRQVNKYLNSEQCLEDLYNYGKKYISEFGVNPELIASDIYCLLSDSLGNSLTGKLRTLFQVGYIFGETTYIILKDEENKKRENKLNNSDQSEDSWVCMYAIRYYDTHNKLRDVNIQVQGNIIQRLKEYMLKKYTTNSEQLD